MSEQPETPQGALETAAALRAGELDVEDLAERTLDAARSMGAEVGAFAHLLEDLTREQARAVAERLEESRRSGAVRELADQLPLLGVPLPI
ncbi:MAG: amidase, partial [Brachybacterium sp.]|nr:amidase [Brachybacterium sp.]